MQLSALIERYHVKPVFFALPLHVPVWMEMISKVSIEIHQFFRRTPLEQHLRDLSLITVRPLSLTFTHIESASYHKRIGTVPRSPQTPARTALPPV